MKFSPYVVTILAIALIAGAMTGCSKHHEENTADYSMPEEMKDCKVFYIAPDGMGSPIHVVYCPGKTTVAERYAVGKTHRDVNVVTDAEPAEASTVPAKHVFYHADGTPAVIGESKPQFSHERERIFVLANGSYLRCDPENGKLVCDNNKQ